MNDEEVKSVEKTIGYEFRNIDLLQQAFVRRSYSKENGGENNEILEFIGDKVLDLAIVMFLVERYGGFCEDEDDFDINEGCNEFVSKYSEGKLTEIKKKLVKKETLAERIDALDLAQYLIMGNGDIKNNADKEDSVKEDLFEAIIGAIALDSNWNLEAVRNSVDEMLYPHRYLDDSIQDCFSVVEQWTRNKYSSYPDVKYSSAANQGSLESYEVMAAIMNAKTIHAESDYSPERSWLDKECSKNHSHVCYIKLGDYEYGFLGYGKNQKHARQKAFEIAYTHLKNKGLLFRMADEIGNPRLEYAINQLQELYQKGYIDKPCYDFFETKDAQWKCECHLGKECTEGVYQSKKYGKKAVAYDMLCNILDKE